MGANPWDLNPMYFVEEKWGSNSPDSFESAPINPLNSPTSSAPATNTESGDGPGSPTSTGSTHTRTLRGPNKGLNLDKIISTGKIKISFNFGEKIPAKNVLEFSEGIGIAVRAHAPLKNVSTWRNISQEHKEACHLRLLHWFEIEDWTTERVQTLVDKQFQKSYRQWRNTLHTEYKKYVKNGQDPRLFSPRLEVDIDSWKAICDFFESTKFKVRSEINATNRRRAPFSHTSGKIRALTRYRKMINPSKIDLWRMTHVRKNGVFVNSQAKMTYRKMNLLESETMDEGGEPMSEDQILVAALGRRSGYQKGMGDGVEVPRRGNFILGAQQDPELKKKLSDTESKLCDTQSKLSETQIEVGLAMCKIDKLIEDLESQKKMNKSSDQILLSEKAYILQMEEILLQMEAYNTGNVSSRQRRRAYVGGEPMSEVATLPDPELKKKLSDAESKLCETQSKLSETQIELRLVMGKIDKLTEDLESQKEIGKTNDQTFELAQEQKHQIQLAMMWKTEKLFEDLESQKEISKTNDQTFELAQEQIHQIQLAIQKMEANNTGNVSSR